VVVGGKDDAHAGHRPSGHTEAELGGKGCGHPVSPRRSPNIYLAVRVSNACSPTRRPWVPVSQRGRTVASRADPVRARGTGQTGASRQRAGAVHRGASRSCR
jgi:hypothetical protein